MFIDVVKATLPAILAFFVGIAVTPCVSNYLYKNKMWKKKAGKRATDGGATPVYDKLYATRDVGTPRMGGVVIWASAAIVAFVIWILHQLTSIEIFDKLEFVSRNQTWIPFATLIVGALVGLIDDYLEVKGSMDYFAGGLSLKKRLLIVGALGIAVASWFYIKLDVTALALPFIADLSLGWLIVPLITFVIMAIYSGGVIDGLDGLSGGIFAVMYSAYGVIAFSLNQVDLAAFCMLIVGSILAFLWFNIPPARFYMSETGSMPLTITLGVIAFMTDSLVGGVGVLVLPFIALPLFVTVGSSIIQLLSKRFRNGKKIFISAPLHHHFEALGWPATKIVMRYWILSVIFATIGVIIALIA